MRDKGIKSNFQAYLAVLTFVSLIVLIGIQVSWIFKAARFEEKQFNDKVASTLKCVKKELGKRASSCSNMKDYLSGNKCAATIGQEKIKEVDSIVNHFLDINNIELEYDFSIGDSIIEAEQRKLFGSKCYLESLNGLIEQDGIRLCMRFPSRNQFILAQIKGWFMVSIISILFIAFSFFITMRMFIKEKMLMLRTTDFINNMVHEFQTPLANIKFASNLIRKKSSEPKNDKIEEYTNVITDESNRLERNVEQILNLACPSRNNGETDFVDIHEVIKNCISQYQYKISEINCEIETALNARQYLLIGERNQMHLMVSNLIDNALKYASKSPLIQIETTNINDTFVLLIKDNGIGIDKKNLPFIFDKYYRISTGDVHDVKGFGLGLTYVQKITHLYNGSISVRSQIGKGTEFKVTIPVRNEHSKNENINS